MNKPDRAEMYRAFLAAEGYAPKIDGDGDVVFKFEGGHYLIVLDEDEDFVRIIYPNFWSIDDDVERQRAAEASLHVTTHIKVAKVFIVGDSTWATVEMFCASPEAVLPMLFRCLSALRTAVHTFKEKMTEGVPA